MQNDKFRTDPTFFWDVAETNFALLTLVFLYKLCLNTLGPFSFYYKENILALRLLVSLF